MQHAPQKVFGLGLSRTGTTSLTTALDMLGYKSIHFPLTILKIKKGHLTLNPEAIDQFDAFTDTPVARMYKEIDKTFPGSKFILTTRDIDSWTESMRRLNFSYTFLKFLPKVYKVTQDLYGTHSFNDGKKLKERFKKHEMEVLNYFGDRVGQDLLIFNLSKGDGWKKLCTFLGKSVPQDTPFPKDNQGHTTTFNNIVDFLKFVN